MRYYAMQNAADNFTVENVIYREDVNFLEGFYYDADRVMFYESTGLRGKSEIHDLVPDADANTLTVLDKSKMQRQYFGEGLAPRNENEFAVLTYKARKVYIVDRDTMAIKD